MNWTAPPATAALIFDCDGTLADTMPIHYRAWTAVLDRHAIPFPEERFYQLGGMPTGRIISLLAEEHGVLIADVDRTAVEKEEVFLSYLAEVEAIETVVRIAAVYRRKLPMAVASGGYRDVVSRTLSAIGVRDWFDVLVCAEDVARHKPDPDVFLEAARRLGVESGRCVVFEDTDIGLEAARRAGMAAVDVRRLLTRPHAAIDPGR
jgi:HAD superfamily hydrolase (TIGR01549 family)